MSKSYERVGENNKKYRQSTTIFSITENFSMSDEESHRRRDPPTRKRIWKITSSVFIVFFYSAKKAIQ